MLLLKTRIPVDLSIIQPEMRLVLLYLCLQIWLASQDFHLENPVLILYCAHLQGEHYLKEQEGFTWCPDGIQEWARMLCCCIHSVVAWQTA